MIYLPRIAMSVLAASTLAFSQPAAAQQNPGGLSQPAPTPQQQTPDIAPPALPGAAPPSLQTAPSVAKPLSGDPTAQLFTAINNGDYGAAQDAVSRGADLNAQNNLGETPLDLSIALNRNSITFMMLSARNEDGDTQSGPPPVSHPVLAKVKTKPKAELVKLETGPVAAAAAAPGNDPGTPNPEAGFLGFGYSK